jgi:ABC-2 type transport system permease protein
VLLDLLSFEWRYHVRQPAFPAVCVVLFLLGFATAASGFGAANVGLASSYLVTQTAGFLSLLLVFPASIFAASAVLRDVEHRLDGILFSTPITRAQYLVSRLGGAFAATLSVAACALLGSALARFAPWVEPERIRVFSATPYLVAFALVMVPNVLFVCVLLFALAIATRNALATYSGSVLVYALYLVTAALTNSPLMAGSRPGAGGGGLAALLDPFGLASFFEVTRLWTASAKNAALVAVQPLFLANRALWVGLSLALAVVLLRTLALQTGRAVAKTRMLDVPAAPVATVLAPLPSVSVTHAPLHEFLSRCRIEVRLLRTRPTVALLVLSAVVASTEIFGEILRGEYGAALQPATGLILDAIRNPFEILGLILMIFFAAEVFWREERDRVASILNATPASSAVFVGGKLVALATIAFVLGIAMLLPGIGLQLLRGAGHIHLLAYLSFLASSAVPVFLFGVAFLSIQALSPGKYTGIVLSLAFLLVAKRPSMLGLDSPLWRFGSTPPLRFSEMSGFGFDAPPFLAWLFLWIVVASILVLLTTALWRALPFSVPERTRLLRGAPLRVIAVLGIVVATTAVALSRYSSSEPLNDWKAAYETRYQFLRREPAPAIAKMSLTIDARLRRVHIEGRYALINRGVLPLSRVWIALRRDARDVTFEVQDGTLRTRDPRFGMYELALTRPIPPGAEFPLTFRATFTRERFDAGADDALSPNGTVLMSFRTLPSLGYRASYEITDPRERRKRNLPRRTEDIEGDVPAHAEDIRFDATILTAADETPIAPGTRTRVEIAGDRKSTRFEAESIRNFFGIAIARYASATRTQGHQRVELLFEPKHSSNAKKILDTAMVALEICQNSFGPYPRTDLRMAEVPSHWNFGALALPGTVFLTEHRTFLIDTSDPSRMDLLARRVAHEVGHQWWGFEVAPASAPGATMLVESLAKYTELLVIEQLHGREHVRRMLEVDRDRYLAGRANDETSEAPLLRVGNQPHLYYGKGAVVFWAIGDLIGEEKLNDALRSFVAEQRSRHGRTRADDLLPHLRRVTSAAKFAQVEQWLADIVLYDFAVTAARARRLPDGRSEVNVDVTGRKVRADGEGNETPLPLQEAVAIRITDRLGKSLYEGKHVLTGKNRLRIVIDAQPDAVEVDPWLTRIDTRLEDNFARFDR